MRSLSLSVIVGLGIFCLRAEPVLVRIDSGERDLTADEKAAVSGATEVIKTGKGTLAPAQTTFSGFAGTLRVKEGYLKLLGSNWIPTSAKISVEWSDETETEGGTLQFYGTGNTFNTGTPIEFCGTGVGGTAGALAMDGFTAGDMDLQRTTMTGDALIAGNSGRPFRFNTSNGLDMQGHTLTVHPTKSRELVLYTSVKNPGTIVVEAGTFRPGYGATQIAGGTVVIKGSAQMGLYKWGSNTKDFFPWTIKTAWEGTPNGEKTLFNGSPDSANPKPQPLDGPLVLNGGWTNLVTSGVLANRNGCRQFKGDISGTGSIRLNNGSTWTEFSGENTMAGSLNIDSGYAVFNNVKAVPQESYDNVKVGSSTGAFLLARPQSEAYPDGYDAEAVYDMITYFQRKYNVITDRQVYVYAEGPEIAEVPGVMALDGDQLKNNEFPFRTYGPAVKFTVSLANKPRLYQHSYFSNADTVILSTPEADGGVIRSLTVAQGRMKLENFGYVDFTNDIWVSGTASCAPRLIVGANSTLDQHCKRYSKTQPSDPVSYLRVGGMNKGCRGVVEVLDGGVLTNSLQLSSSGYDRSLGVAYIRQGGQYYNTGRAGWDTSFPSAMSEGYLEVDGGTFNTGSGFYIGSTANGLGMVYVKGGLYAIRGNWKGTDSNGPHVAREGLGVFYQTGGSVVSPNSLWIGSSNYRNNDTFNFSHAAYTVDGAAAVTRVGVAVYAGARGFCNAYLNLNDGGTIETPAVLTPLVQPLSGNDGLTRVLSNQVVYVGFDGGRLRANGDSTQFLGALNQTASYTWKDASDAKQSGKVTGDTTPDFVTVYANGAILDSSNFTVRVNAPLVRPPVAGGIRALTVPASLPKYIAAPLVKITGDGQGASAVALFDSTNGVVTGVRMTSPGWGYTAANTTAVLYHGTEAHSSADPTNITLTVTLGDNALTGGLTVEGSGTVELAAANTYGGATFVKGGTLKVAHDQAIPAGSAILLGDQGVLDMNGRHLPAGSTVALADPQAFAAHDRSFTLMENVVDDITVTNADQLPGNWSVRVVNGRLRANSGKGMLIFVR